MNHEIHEAHEKAETLAEIVAEMRKVKGFSVPYAPSGHNGVWTADLVEFADRIEEAAKRERGEIEQRAIDHTTAHMDAVHRDNCRDCVCRTPVGDTAAMRDVVTALAAVILPPRDKAKKDGWLDWVRAMQKKARAALSAPPHNCDRFGGETEAMIAFLNEVWLISVKSLKDDPFDEWTPEMKARYAKWLMEQKGETDGGK